MVQRPLYTTFSAIPAKQGLYDPLSEKDSCGLAMVATLRGTSGHDIVENALTALRNLEHRGAVGSDAGTGDGAGILTQIPDAFLRSVVDFELPAEGLYAAGLAFLPVDAKERRVMKTKLSRIIAEEKLKLLGWREVPVNPEILGELARETMPAFEQLFIGYDSVHGEKTPEERIELDRLSFRLRKRAERELGCYFVSLSARTLGYKGMVTTLQLEPFYPDLSNPLFATKLALVHSRYSTNTFPSWPLAQPMRMMAHNGEINTVKGNRNWMLARQSQLQSDSLGDLASLFPICTPDASDSASFDEVVELLNLSGRSLPHAMLMMAPEAWENNPQLDPKLRDFYRYHATLMEQWEGPAALGFTDGTLLGATLDRNGLRPGRFVVTDDGLVVLGSEVGILDFDPKKIVRKGRLQPGKMFLVDTENNRIIEDEEIKRSLSEAEPYGDWLNDSAIKLSALPEREHIVPLQGSLLRRQRTFGYTEEEIRILLRPMAQSGAEPLGAMGSDTPIAVLAQRPRLLFDYFVQQFAQVTNPPLDSIREEVITSLRFGLGPRKNLLSAGPEHAEQIQLDFPVINNDELAKIRYLDGGARSQKLRGLYRIEGGAAELENRLNQLCDEADQAVANGIEYLILSDRDSTQDLAPIPSLLMLATVHNHLIRSGTRMRLGLLVEAGDVREVHHVAALIGYGASAVNPYLAMETCENLVLTGRLTGVTAEKAVQNLIKALGKGVLKIMSKMGISTVSAYSGAQQFEALGLSQEFIDEYFTGTLSKLGGVGIAEVAAENESRHSTAYPINKEVLAHRALPVGGEYQWRREGPPHLFNPETVFRLQHSTRTGQYEVFKEYTKLVDDQAEQLKTLRGLFKLKAAESGPIPIEEVEPASNILKRFQTGAMSYGSISKEAHETLAIAMNRIGGKSNTGEGGEDPERLLDPSRRSAIKQVASGRFGVTSLYLSNADDIQIKMAQGAKPGEGGQLPPGKMYPWVARTRHATAGVGLISPPPHHDIYSIEDLKQLIFDLKRANPSARIQVKLVSQSGIGAVAAGVVKALADVVLVSGHDGGTGASPLNSLKHAGTPWEIGLAEAQQTLRLNNMRSRVVLQVDGQLKTGRDVIIGALLGAEEFGFATAPLVVSGCIMMRVCHLDTCPVGVATQNPVLRERFTGKPEFVENFFRFIAEEVREHLAELGFRSLDEIIGHQELIEVNEAVEHWKASQLDLAPILADSASSSEDGLRKLIDQEHELAEHFDQQLIELSEAALNRKEPVVIELPIRNTDRAVGTMLGHEVTKRFGEAGLATETIDITVRGTAGQSFGAFVPAGIKLRLEGDTNDYFGKGLSGGDLVVRPARDATLVAEQNVIAGNVIGYGATSGTMFIRGLVGERFLVRNSGATAVVEGVGDHAMEYMTGGIAVILGETGRNLGAGMSGGFAYIYRFDESKVNEQSISTGELEVQELDRADVELLRSLLVQHFENTESAVAKRILDDYSTQLQHFVKLIPSGYAAVLEIKQQAEAEGLDTDGESVWQQILEVTDGRS